MKMTQALTTATSQGAAVLGMVASMALTRAECFLRRRHEPVIYPYGAMCTRCYTDLRLP